MFQCHQRQDQIVPWKIQRQAHWSIHELVHIPQLVQIKTMGFACTDLILVMHLLYFMTNFLLSRS